MERDRKALEDAKAASAAAGDCLERAKDVAAQQSLERMTGETGKAIRQATDGALRGAVQGALQAARQGGAKSGKVTEALNRASRCKAEADRTVARLEAVCEKDRERLAKAVEAVDCAKVRIGHHGAAYRDEPLSALLNKGMKRALAGALMLAGAMIAGHSLGPKVAPEIQQAVSSVALPGAIERQAQPVWDEKTIQLPGKGKVSGTGSWSEAEQPGGNGKWADTAESANAVVNTHQAIRDDFHWGMEAKVAAGERQGQAIQAQVAETARGMGG